MASSSLTAQSGKAGLIRQLGLVSAAALVVSNMVGTGIFTTTGFLAGDLGSVPLVLLIWCVGALCALAGAFCYSELGVNNPSSGGEYVYLSRAFGPTWGFMTGWVSFFAGFSAPIAAAALAFSDYLSYFHPALRQANAPVLFGSGDMAFRLGGAQMAACLIIALFTALNCLGVQHSARVQNGLTAFKLLVVASFIVLGFALGNGDWQNFSAVTERTSSRPIVQQFAVSLFYVYTSYSGWNAATYVAEELRQPDRTLPWALTCGTLLVTVLYVGLNAVFLYGAPLGELKGVFAVGSTAAVKLFGPGVAGIFSALMAFSLLATVNAMVTIGPRVYYAMAHKGAFFAAAGRLHPRRQTPMVAIVAQGLCAMLMTLTPFPQLFFYIGFTLNFFAVVTVLALLFLRRTPGWRKLPVVSFAYPLVPVAFITVGLWMTYFGMTLRPAVAGFAIATVALGAVVFRLRRGTA